MFTIKFLILNLRKDVLNMPPKVSRVVSKPTKAIAKASTSSSSRSSGSSSKTSSSSRIRKSATTASRPAPEPKPKNVDKVDFGKPKTIVDAGVYKPAPPKPSKAEEIARIAAEKRAESQAQLPSLVLKANEAFEIWQKAVGDVRTCQHDLARAQKRAEERREHPIKNVAIVAGGAYVGGGAQELE